MKNYLLPVFALLVVGCGRQSINNNIDNLKDSINWDKLDDTITPTMLSELNTLIDTLYAQTQSEEITTRVNAQLVASSLVPILASNYHNAQIDTALLSKMSDKINLIIGEWYIEQRGDKKLWGKEILYNDSIFQIGILTRSNKCSRLAIIFPENAQSNPILFFSKNDFPTDNEDPTVIRLDEVLPADSIVVNNGGHMMVFCDPKTMDYFLNNAVVYIGYINDNENEGMENRFEIGRLRLARFHEQYNDLYNSDEK